MGLSRRAIRTIVSDLASVLYRTSCRVKEWADRNFSHLRGLLLEANFYYVSLQI